MPSKSRPSRPSKRPAKVAKKRSPPPRPARPVAKAAKRPAHAKSRPAPPKGARPSTARPTPKPASRPAVKPKSPSAAPKLPETPALRPTDRVHVLSLSFLRDGDEFMARLETDAGQITELKNRSLDQLLTLVASELEDLLE